MSRKRVARGVMRYFDSRWTFMHRLQAGAFAVFIAGVIIGISALATQAAMSVDQYTNASSTRSTVGSRNFKQSELAQLSNEAQSTVAEVAISKTTKQNNPAVSCNQALRQFAKNAQFRKLSAEASRHRHVVRALQNTGLVTRFLNPNMYGYRMTSESKRHQIALRSIQLQYNRDLASAHCKM